MTRRPRLAPSAAETARRIPASERKPAGVPALEILRAAARAALAKKARAPVALDLRELDGVCDYFFICSASSEVQVKAVAEGVEDALRERAD